MKGFFYRKALERVFEQFFKENNRFTMLEFLVTISTIHNWQLGFH